MPTPSPTPNPSNPVSKPERRSPWPLRVWRFSHGLCRLCWRTFLILLCLLLYMWLIGLPGALVNRGLRTLDTRPFRVGLQRVTFDPTAGLVASGLYLYHQEDFSEPLARVQKVVLRPDWRTLTQGRFQLKSLLIEQGSLRLPSLLRSNASPVRLSAHGISGRIDLFTNRVELAPLALQLFGVHWQATGAVLRLPATHAGGFWPELHHLLSSIARAPPAAAEVAAELNALHFDPAPEARVGFRYDPATTNGWQVQVQAEGTHALIRGATFDHVQADVQISGYQIALRNLVLGAQGRRGHLQGTLNLASRQVAARLFSDLPPDPWIAMLPAKWRDELRAADISVGGSMKSELWIGPAALENLAQSLHGWVSLEKSYVRGIPLEKGYCAIQVEGDTVRFSDLSAVVGQAAGRGPMDGTIVWQRQRHELSGDVRLHFDPNLIVPILSSNQARLVRRFAFTNQPPQFDGHFQHLGGDRPSLQVLGQLRATDCSYRGVALTSIVATLSVDQDAMALDSWVFSRPDGTITGRLRYAWSDHLFTVDLAGDMNPHAVAGLVGPGLQHALAITRYEGPVFMHARGVVDGRSSDHRTDLQLRVEGQRMGVSNWLADTATFDLHARGGTYETTNVTGTAFGGAFTARVLAQPSEAGTDLVFKVTAAMTNAELSRLAARVKPDTHTNHKGRLQLDLTVEGPVTDPDHRQLKGKGVVHVQDGEVMRLPLFGGLSGLLSVIYPGLGFAAQNDLHATFDVRDGRIITKDARVEGSVVSMKAGGYYAFDGKVRFNVEVQLLRKGPLATVLRFVTLPVTKLLMFQLSGTMQDPQWRPVNLPKELFLIFE